MEILNAVEELGVRILIFKEGKMKNQYVKMYKNIWNEKKTAFGLRQTKNVERIYEWNKNIKYKMEVAVNFNETLFVKN